MLWFGKPWQGGAGPAPRTNHQPTMEGKHMTQSTLHITDSSGDTRIMWDPRNPEEVKTAKAAFDEAKNRGMLAYSVDPNSGERTGEVIKDFDKKAGKIIMVRQTVGG